MRVMWFMLLGVILLFMNGCTQNILYIGCTKEAKICSDGSTVGRIPPNCDFAPCPGMTNQSNIPDEKYCEKDTDCACGVRNFLETKECFFGNKKYVDTSQQCPDFCTGITGDRLIKCINNECKQTNSQINPKY